MSQRTYLIFHADLLLEFLHVRAFLSVRAFIINRPQLRDGEFVGYAYIAMNERSLSHHFSRGFPILLSKDAAQ